jgi:dTDP-4-amino-4,6-dideoxygalactose transaminase|tara:strand:- start:6403 stop:7464 length:1062 start_codon:yes stop_codon:yes gene_type:complete
MDEIDAILKSGILSGFRANREYHLGGHYVQSLEVAFKDYFGVEYAVALNSATAGLHVALRACGVGAGDEVIVTPYSFSASASCVLMAGATPVFADIQDETFCLDYALLEKVISPHTKAIIPVHLCGHPADMYEIMNFAEFYNLKVIEDAAQSIGAKYLDDYTGTIGDCGVFSFNQSKHINTGEGGMLITDNGKIAEIARAVRNHGEVSVPELKILGYNYRMTEIEAAIGLEQFNRLDELIAVRVRNAEMLTEGLKGIKGLTPPVTYPGCTHSFYTYALKTRNKQKLCKQLGKRGIYFGTYVKPLHLLPIFGHKKGLCPVAERMYEEELIVTDSVKDPDLDTDYIINAFRQIMV